MAWSMYYNGEPIAGNISLEGMQQVSDLILECLSTGQPVWYDQQFPKDDGIGFHRMLIQPGVAVSFHEEEPGEQFTNAGRLSGF